MSLKRRLIGNGIASAGSIFWTALAQLVSVPVLVHAWGVNTYGIWLMLTTIPSYFALSDLGFSAAASSDMRLAFARDERDRVLVTFQSVLLLAVAISGAAMMLAFPLLFLSAPDPHAAWWRVNNTALFAIISYSAAILCSRIFLSALGATGHYALGTLVYDFVQAVEGFAVLGVALFGGGFAEAALALLVARTINIAILFILLRHLRPWLSIGFGVSRRSELRRLLTPALGAMALPIALSINIQGMTLVAGALISPGAAATLGTVRTASRIGLQLVGVVNRATLPEFSAASAVNDLIALRRIARLNVMSICLILAPAALLFSTFGARFVEAWTGGRIAPSNIFIALMALAMFLNGLWYFSSNLLLATNSHGRLSFVASTAAVVAVILAAPLARIFALDGVAISVAAAEFSAVAYIALNWKHYSGKIPILRSTRALQTDVSKSNG